jgi:hypothetical protein
MLMCEPGPQVLLVALPAGASFADGDLTGPAGLQVLDGNVAVHRAGGVVHVAAGEFLLLRPDALYGLEATDDSAFILTVGSMDNVLSTETIGSAADVGEPW